MNFIFSKCICMMLMWALMYGTLWTLREGEGGHLFTTACHVFWKRRDGDGEKICGELPRRHSAGTAASLSIPPSVGGWKGNCMCLANLLHYTVDIILSCENGWETLSTEKTSQIVLMCYALVCCCTPNSRPKEVHVIVIRFEFKSFPFTEIILFQWVLLHYAQSVPTGLDLGISFKAWIVKRDETKTSFYSLD